MLDTIQLPLFTETNTNTKLICPIHAPNNTAIAQGFREVLAEIEVPKVGSAFVHPALDHLYEHYEKVCASPLENTGHGAAPDWMLKRL